MMSNKIKFTNSLFRINKMNNKYLTIFVLPLLLMIAGCDLGVKQEYETSDAELIQMIIDSDKVDIDISELPEQSQTYLSNDGEYDELGSRYASQLGYEVERIGKGSKSGRRGDVYFNVEGRKLNPNDWGKRGRGFGVGKKEDWECFTLEFPVSFNMPDGSLVTVEADDEENWAEIKTWYETNQDSEERPTMQFPVGILFDEESLVIENQEEMRSAYQECYPKRDGEWSRDRDETCFYLVYPVTYVMPDGSTISVTSDDEDGWSDLKDWYEENEDSEDKPELQYPVDIVVETEEGSSTVTINGEEEMASAKRECYDNWEDGYDQKCFELVYPVTYVMPDGSTISVTSDDEDGWSDLKDWYEENEDSEDKPELQYPVDIVVETEEGSSTVTINGEEEMASAKRECHTEWEEDWDEDDERDCFEYVLPVTFLMPDGSTITVEDEEGWYSLRVWYEENRGYEEEPSIQYPIDISQETEEGLITVTLTSGEEMEEVYSECYDD